MVEEREKRLQELDRALAAGLAIREPAAPSRWKRSSTNFESDSVENPRKVSSARADHAFKVRVLITPPAKADLFHIGDWIEQGLALAGPSHLSKSFMMPV